MTTTLQPDYTTTFPEELARQLNLRPGAQLAWQANDGRILVHIHSPAPDKLVLLQRLREQGRKHKKAGQDAVKDLIREREQDDLLREDALR